MRLVCILRYRSLTDMISEQCAENLGWGGNMPDGNTPGGSAKRRDRKYVRAHVKEGGLQVSNAAAQVARRLRVVNSRAPPATPSRQLPKTGMRLVAQKRGPQEPYRLWPLGGARKWWRRSGRRPRRGGGRVGLVD